MKVVCCKNCGAKYQLDDDDDISTFECSSCAGDLEYLENYSEEPSKSKRSFMNSLRYDNSFIVQCNDCGLKYKIKSTDNILDYECDSCGGSLRYLDDELNRELNKYLDERREELAILRKENESKKPEYEEQNTEDNSKSLKTITGKLENFFSEERLLEIAESEKQNEELEGLHAPKTARTTIPDAVLSKFGSEFAVPKTNDYNVLKSFLKDEFFKGISKYYVEAEAQMAQQKTFIERISIEEPDIGGLKPETTSINGEEVKFNITDISSNGIIIIIGAVIFIISIIEILIINSGVGIFALIIGVVILCYGLYKTRDVKEIEERTRIIREHLLTLPEDYYVFYNVKIPTSNTGINHLVVGPTGIYALLSQKYTPKPKLDSESETLNLIESDDYIFENRIEYDDGDLRKFRYTTKQAKFSQDNKIKQKALSLGEDLINFLNENDIKNCFVEPLVGFINNEVVVINMPLTDEDLFIDELLNKIQTSTIKLDPETIDKCAVLINTYSADCSSENL